MSEDIYFDTIKANYERILQTLTVLFRYNNPNSDLNVVFALTSLPMTSIRRVRTLYDLNAISDVLLTEPERELKAHIITRFGASQTPFSFQSIPYLSVHTTNSHIRDIVVSRIRPFLKQWNETVYPDTVYMERYQENRRVPFQNNYALEGTPAFEPDTRQWDTSMLTHFGSTLNYTASRFIEPDGNYVELVGWSLDAIIRHLRQHKRAALASQRRLYADILQKYWTSSHITHSFLETTLTESRTILYSDKFVSDQEARLKRAEDLMTAEGRFFTAAAGIRFDRSIFTNLEYHYTTVSLETEIYKQKKGIDLQSVFKFFQLTDIVPYSKYSFGHTFGRSKEEKNVRIYQPYFTSENIPYLERWTRLNTYKGDFPTRPHIQWRGIYNWIEWNLYLFHRDATIRIDVLRPDRSSNATLGLFELNDLVKILDRNVIRPIITILQNMNIMVSHIPLQINQNVRVIYGEVEYHIQTKNEFQNSTFQDLVERNRFLFSGISPPERNQIINLEFARIDNYRAIHSLRDKSPKIMKALTQQIRMRYGTSPQLTDADIIVLKEGLQRLFPELTDNREALDYIYYYTNNLVGRGSLDRNAVSLEILGTRIGTNDIYFSIQNISSVQDTLYAITYMTLLLCWSQDPANRASLRSYSIPKELTQEILSTDEEEEEEAEDAEEIARRFAFFKRMQGLQGIISEEEEEEEDEILEIKPTKREDVNTGEEFQRERTFRELEEELRREEPNPDLDGNKYYLRRLKAMDDKQFGFDRTGSLKSYASQAPADQNRQPIALTEKQYQYILKYYQERTGKEEVDTDIFGGINRIYEGTPTDPYAKTYVNGVPMRSYAIRHRNLYYMCPKIWCMLCRLPFRMQDTKELVRLGARTYKPNPEVLVESIRSNLYVESFEHPELIRCPKCENGIYGIRGVSNGTLLYLDDKHGRHAYPGFLSREKNPNGLCMVACFKEPNQRFEECDQDPEQNRLLGQDTKSSTRSTKRVDRTNWRLTLKVRPNETCEYGRFGILPPQLDSWMNYQFVNSLWIDNKRQSFVDKIGFRSFLRVGILEQSEQYYESFTRTLMLLLSTTRHGKEFHHEKEIFRGQSVFTMSANRTFRQCLAFIFGYTRNEESRSADNGMSEKTKREARANKVLRDLYIESFGKTALENLMPYSDIRKAFMAVRRGSLFQFFRKRHTIQSGDISDATIDEALNSFYNYILKSATLQPRFILPFLAFPGVYMETGINFFVLSETDGQIGVQCEYLDYQMVQFASTGSSKRKAANMFIYMYHTSNVYYKREYYEPIVYVQNTGSGELPIIDKQISGPIYPFIEQLLDKGNEYCQMSKDPWVAYQEDISRTSLQEKTLDYSLSENRTILDNLLNPSPDNKYIVLNQITNRYNQTQGLIVSRSGDKQRYYVPLVPQEVIIRTTRLIKTMNYIPIVNIEAATESLQRTSMIDTIQFLTEFAEDFSVKYHPKYYTLSSSETLSGLYLENGLWVPVQDMGTQIKTWRFIEKEGIRKWNLHVDGNVDRKGHSGISKVEEIKSDILGKLALRKWGYEKFKFEMARSMKEDRTIRKRTKDILRKLEDRQITGVLAGERLSDALREYITENVAQIVPEDIQWSLEDKGELFQHCSSFDNSTCSVKKGMCGWFDGSCRLAVGRGRFEEYVERLAHEILFNIIKRGDVMEGYRRSMEEVDDQLAFYTREEILAFLNAYDYGLENRKYIPEHPIEHYDYATPASPPVPETYVYKKHLDETKRKGSRRRGPIRVKKEVEATPAKPKRIEVKKNTSGNTNENSFFLEKPVVHKSI